MKRILKLLNRYRIAREMGFRFLGAAHTANPERLRLNGKWVPLSFPKEESSGINPDFINVLMEDEYGLREFVPDDISNVVDVGANIGLFSIYAWKHFPSARIHAYEPNPRVLDCTRHNLKETSAQLFECGVSSQGGKCTMIDNGESRGASTQLCTDGSIELIPFKQVIQAAGDKIDLLKLDCEGAEWDILRVPEIRKVRHIRMEYHLSDTHPNPDELYQIAESIGFCVTRLSRKQSWDIAWLDRIGN